MKVDSLKIHKVFSGGGDIHYVLPYFQREYTWDKEQWQVLLDDSLAIYDEYQEDEPPEHFMGSLVVIEDGLRNGVIPALKLVDGQQRLTTISLMLCALQRLVRETNPQLAAKISKMLLNQDETGELRYKILPTTKSDDRACYMAVLDLNDQEITNTRSNIARAFSFLHGKIKSEIEGKNIEPNQFFNVLINCLQVVFITLVANEKPYKIFESLNAKGKPLTQPDLIRNYVAMKVASNNQEELFTKYWSQMEFLLDERRTVGRLGELTSFLRNYLAMHTRVLCDVRHVYARFRDRMESSHSSWEAFSSEMANLKRFAVHYDKILRPEITSCVEIGVQLQRLNTLDTSSAYPLLLAFFDAKESGELQESEIIEALAILENYMIRRFLASEPSNYLNKMFPTLWKEIDRNRFVESFREILVNKNYPDDERIRRAVLTDKFYGSATTNRKTSLILGSINRHLSSGSGGFTTLDDSATIEHILPQSPDESWQSELREDLDQIQRTYTDTFGNLTLVTQEWNSSLSNAPFTVKKEKLASHGLKLNADYFSTEIQRWDASAIKSRASYLADEMVQIWPLLGQAPGDRKYGHPVMLHICGEPFEVNSWRDVAYETLKFVSEKTEQFPAISRRFPAHLSPKAFPRASKQLPNGWYINTHLGRDNIRGFCRNVMTAAGFGESDWKVQ